MNNTENKNFAIGIDLVEIESIEKVYIKHSDRFALRILTPKEFKLFKRTQKKVNFLAGRFAAKEAIFKALGTGFKKFGPAFKSLEILPNDLGQPILEVLQPLNQHVELFENYDRQWSISISHHKSYATAIAMWLKKSAAH